MTKEVEKKKTEQRSEDRGETPYKGGSSKEAPSPKRTGVKPPWTRGADSGSDFLVK